jgi:hypothetical protein
MQKIITNLIGSEHAKKKKNNQNNQPERQWTSTGLAGGELLHQRVGNFLAQLNVVGALPRHGHINVLDAHGFHDLLLLGQHAKSKLAGLVLNPKP